MRVWVGGCMCADNKISGLALHPIFHRFSPFSSCLSVVLWLDKSDYLECCVLS